MVAFSEDARYVEARMSLRVYANAWEIANQEDRNVSNDVASTQSTALKPGIHVDVGPQGQ